MDACSWVEMLFSIDDDIESDALAIANMVVLSLFVTITLPPMMVPLPINAVIALLASWVKAIVPLVAIMIFVTADVSMPMVSAAAAVVLQPALKLNHPTLKHIYLIYMGIKIYANTCYAAYSAGRM